MSVVSMKQLLEAGVHFGHQTRRWNPKAIELNIKRNITAAFIIQQNRKIVHRMCDSYQK